MFKDKYQRFSSTNGWYMYTVPWTPNDAATRVWILKIVMRSGKIRVLFESWEGDIGGDDKSFYLFHMTNIGCVWRLNWTTKLSTSITYMNVHVHVYESSLIILWNIPAINNEFLNNPRIIFHQYLDDLNHTMRLQFIGFKFRCWSAHWCYWS